LSRTLDAGAARTAPPQQRPAPAARGSRLSWELALVLAVQFALVAGQLRTGWLDDDAVNSSFRDALRMAHIGYFTAVHQTIDAWLDVGRFYPLSTYQGAAIGWALHGLVLYKAFLLVIVAATSAAFWWLLRELGLDRRSAALVVLVASVAFQFRAYHDPIISYGGLLPILFAELCVSLVLFNRFLGGRRAVHMAAAVVLFAIACLTYEAAYVFSPLYLLLAWHARGSLRAGLRAAFPVIVASAGFIALGLWVRSRVTIPAGAPYAPGRNLGELITTLFDQITAAVPLIYAAFDPSHIFHPRSHVILGAIGWDDMALGLAVAAVTFLLARAPGGMRWPAGRAAVFAVVLWVLAALPISLANKYQGELVAGLGYLPVYLEYFAMALLALAIVRLVARGLPATARTPALAATAAAVGLVAGVTHQANDVLVAVAQPAKHFRQAVETAGDRGFFAGLPAGATLYADPVDRWQTDAFFFGHSGKRFAVLGPDGSFGLEPQSGHGCGRGQIGRYWMHGVLTDDGDRSLTLLSCLGGPNAREPVLAALGGAAPRDLFVRLPLPLRPGATRAPGEIAGRADRVLAPTARHGIYRAPAGIDLGSAQVADADAKLLWAYRSGCFPQEGVAPDVFRWCERRSRVDVFNTTGRALDVLVGFNVLGSGRGATRLTVDLAGRRRSVPITAGNAVYQQRVRIPAGGAVPVRITTDAGRVPGPDRRDLHLRMVGFAASVVT
jgi:hypothetical protein